MWWLLLTLALAQDPTDPLPGLPEAPVPQAPGPDAPAAPEDPPIDFLPREQANDEAAFPGLEVVAPGARTSIDLVLWIRKDGNYFLYDKLVIDTDLERLLIKERETMPGTRLLVSADEEAPYGRITDAVEQARNAGIERVAVEVMGVKTDEVDPLFTEENLANAIDLTGEGDELTAAELAELKPHRFKFPQNPYAHTDFTAYTLERGEARLGLATISLGITPRVQLTTTPLLDALGVWNIAGKANLIRYGRFDAAITSGIYYVPVTEILNNLGVGDRLNPTNKKKNSPTFESDLSYFEFGVRTSMRLTDQWSAHAGVLYGRINAEGRISLGSLPSVDIPKLGTVGGNQLSIVPKVIGEIAQFKLASDFRFNRRDSLILQFSAPMYVAARGILASDAKNLPKEFRNFHATIGYDRWLKVSDVYAASIAWQFSWKHTDLRVGLPIFSSPNPQWVFQALDLSYRWGGRTRREERELRQAYRDNKRALQGSGD